MTINIFPTPNPIADLAAQLTRRFDTDKDGRLSTQEFTKLLTEMLGSVAAATPPTATPPAPTAPRANEAPIGNMSGFDPAKLANLSHNTPKYEIGRILQRYPNTPEGLRAALPEIQKIAPNAKIIGSKGDKVDFGDYTDAQGRRIGVVDLIQAAGIGGVAWQWLPDGV